jgi:hypothetical protein
LGQAPVPARQLASTISIIGECLSALGLDQVNTIESTVREAMRGQEPFDVGSCALFLEVVELYLGK